MILAVNSSGLVSIQAHMFRIRVSQVGVGEKSSHNPGVLLVIVQ